MIIVNRTSRSFNAYGINVFVDGSVELAAAATRIVPSRVVAVVRMRIGRHAQQKAECGTQQGAGEGKAEHAG